MNRELYETARAAMERAHAPYSRFRVGAAILAGNGGIYAGCNVENAAYPEGICAETAAIAAMVMDGATAIREIAVYGEVDDVLTPCGGCRQRIREFGSPETRIHACNAQGIRRSFTLDELLPFAFGPGHMA